MGIVFCGGNGEISQQSLDKINKFTKKIFNKGKQMKLENGLITQKYTYIECEDKFQFNAPHHFKVKRASDNEELVSVDFQCGPIKESGVNGCCNEDLIAMVIERLKGFQCSEFKCRENAVAQTKLEEALMWLRKRTTDREIRGVEGTHSV